MYARCNNVAGCFVLIDTWWNVNYMNIRSEIGQYPVLIDTWWNVNLLSLV